MKYTAHDILRMRSAAAQIYYTHRGIDRGAVPHEHVGPIEMQLVTYMANETDPDELETEARRVYEEAMR